MFCKNCGSPLQDGSLFCAECGVSVEDTAPQADLPLEEDIDATVSVARASEEYAPTEYYPVQEEASEEYIPVTDADVDTDAENAEENVAFSLNTDGEEIPKKKKNKAPIIIAIVGAVVAVIVALSIIFWDYVTAWFVLSGSPDEVNTKVYKKNLEELLTIEDGEYDYFSALDSVDLTNMGYTGDIHITADKAVLDLLSKSAGTDLSWLNSVTVGYDVSVVENLAKIDYSAKLNGSDLGELTQYMDLQSEEVWLTAPEFFSSVIYMGAEDDYYDGYYDEYMYYRGPTPYEQLTQNQKILDIIPDKEAMETLLVRYCEILMNGFEDVEKSTEKVKVDGISENLTVLTAKMDEGEMRDTLIDVLESVEDDEEIEDFLEDYEKAVGFDGYADMVLDAVPDAIDYLEDADSDDLGDFEITLVTYVNAKAEIVGMELIVETNGREFQPIYFVRVQNGNKFAYEMEIVPSYNADALVIEGSGTVDGKKVNADYDILMAGKKYVTISLKDYTSSKDSYSGTILITPSKDITNSLIANSGVPSQYADFLNLSLEIELSGSNNKSNVEFTVISNGAGGQLRLITVAVSSQMKKPDDIIIPTDNLTEYLPQNQQFLALAKLTERLQAAGFPQELLEQLTSRAVM